MSFRFRLTEKEFASLALQFYYRKPLTLIVLLFVPVYITYIVMNIPLNDINQALPLAILPVIVIFVLPVAKWYEAIRTFQATPALGEETHVQVVGDTIKIDTASQALEHKMSDFRRVINLYGSRVLLFGPGHIVPVPKRILTPEQNAFLDSLKKK